MGWVAQRGSWETGPALLLDFVNLTGMFTATMIHYAVCLLCVVSCYFIIKRLKKNSHICTILVILFVPICWQLFCSQLGDPIVVDLFLPSLPDVLKCRD